MSSARDTLYTDYAPIYDAIGQAAFGCALATFACEWLIQHQRPLTHVLDLACGTGAAAIQLARAGSTVVGLDRSPAMLAIARGRARAQGVDLSLVCADMRSLACTTLPEHADGFDLITCFADSFNYLTGDQDMQLVCEGIAQHLRSGGTLMFDVNTEAEYETWTERAVVIYDDPACLVYNQLDYDPALRLAEGQIVWFVRETDSWWRGSETHKQRAWSSHEIATALQASGLRIETYIAIDEGAAGRRLLYIAMKI